MPFVSSFAYCDEIHTIMTPKGPQPQMGRQLQVLNPYAIPGNFTFAILCNISDLPLDKDSKVRLVFEDPDGQIVQDTGTFDIPETVAQKKKLKGLQMSLEMRNIVLKVEGIYQTKIFVNGEQVGAYQIHVMRGGASD